MQAPSQNNGAYKMSRVRACMTPIIGVALQGTPYEGFYGPMQGMQQMGAYRHNSAAAYSYGMYHSMQHQGRGH